MLLRRQLPVARRAAASSCGVLSSRYNGFSSRHVSAATATQTTTTTERRNDHNCLQSCSMFGLFSPTRVLLCPRRPATDSLPDWFANPSRLQINLWMCSTPDCDTVNNSRRYRCLKCGQKKPNIGQWKCPDCGGLNFRGVKFCKACAAAYQSPREWECPRCHFGSNVFCGPQTPPLCGKCGYDMAPTSEETAVSEADMKQQPQQKQQVQQAQQVMTPETMHDGTIAPSQLPKSDTELLAEIKRATDEKVAAAAGNSDASTGADNSSGGSKPFSVFMPKASVPQEPPQAAATGAGSATAPAVAPGFEWMCRNAKCGTVNPGEVGVCTACNEKMIPGDWSCNYCGSRNHWSRTRCFECQQVVPIAWKCTACETKTSVYEERCRTCNSKRPVVTPAPTASPTKAGFYGQDWICPTCKKTNFAWRSVCKECGLSREDHQVAGVQKIEFVQTVGDSNWRCRYCSASNFRTRETCWQCGKGATAKAVSIGLSGTGAADDDAAQETAPNIAHEGFQAGHENDIAPGLRKSWTQAHTQGRGLKDWICARCFTSNFKNKAKCIRCGADRSDGQAHVGKKSFPKL